MLSEKLLHFLEQVGAEWVLWLLLALGVLAIVVMVERFLFFRRTSDDAAALSKRVVTGLRSGGPDEARRALSGSSGMTSGVLTAALDAYDDGVDAVEEIIQAAIARERVQYDRWLPILGTLGNSAPFVGLLGTVIGIVTAFSALGSNAEGAQLKSDVMNGIGEALVATAVGLAVAIPCVVSFNMFKTRIRTMAANTDSVARILLAHLKSTGAGGIVAGGSSAFDDDEGINEINVVPLVDIMLVLLIIFMVTTQFVQDKMEDYRPPPNVPVELPRAASSEETNKNLLSLAINVDKELFLNGNLTTLDGVRAYVEEMKQKGAKLEAFVAADKRLSHGHVIEVIDTIRLLGIPDVAINTKAMEIQ